MKKIISFLLVLVMLLSLSGCSQDMESQKKEPLFGHLHIPEDELYITNYANMNIDEMLAEAGVESHVAADELQEEINTLSKELVDFVNSKYNVNWKNVEVTTYAVDLSRITGYGMYNAITDPQNAKFYLNTNMMVGGGLAGVEKKVNYISAREIFNIVRYANVGRNGFGAVDNNGYSLGAYTAEAFSDWLIIKFFEEKGEYDVREFFNMNSEYCYTMCALSILEYSIPDLMLYYLTDDHEAFMADFDKLADQCIERPDGQTVTEAQAFMYRADMNQQITRLMYSMLTTGTLEYDYVTLRESWLENIWANFERVFMMSQGCTDTERVEIYRLCYDLFESEGENAVYYLKEILDYFKSCME